MSLDVPTGTVIVFLDTTWLWFLMNPNLGFNQDGGVMVAFQTTMAVFARY